MTRPNEPCPALDGPDVVHGDCFVGDDPNDPDGLEEIRDVLRLDLKSLREGIEGCAEIAKIDVRGATVYITGGITHEDAPTDLLDVIERLRSVRGVLSAAGFEAEA